MKNILFIAVICLIAFTGYSQNKPVKTIQNLKAGIKGETTASAKYAAFAKKARVEGKVAIAKLFDAASKSESIHAANHKKVLEGLGEKMDYFKPEFEVKTTDENLQTAIDGETYEVSTMYPQFLSEAVMEDVITAQNSFSWAFNTEKKHQQFYKKALEALNGNTDKSLTTEYLVCPVCGNTYAKATVDKNCAICQTISSIFINI